MYIKKNIEKPSWFYHFWYTVFRIVFHLFYKNVVVIGEENKNNLKGEAVLLTPTHQNAMMDAMAMLFTTGVPPVFLARADMFKKRLIATLLFFLKILPIFRIRDGKDSLQNNDRIFKETVRIIGTGAPLVVYPEGSHDGHRHFRQVKKGVVRIAFSALQGLEEGKKLHIVPTGIDYNTSYQKAMQTISVYYGKPILVNDFLELYKEDKAKGERQLQLAIHERMKDQMIHIENMDYYDFYDIARELTYPHFIKEDGHKHFRARKLFAQQEMVKALDVKFEKDEKPFAAMQEKALEYKNLVKALKLRDWLFMNDSYSGGKIFRDILGAILVLPISLVGWITSGLQFAITNKFANGKEDPQWRGSMRYIMGLSFFPISYGLLAWLSAIWIDCGWYRFLIFIAMILVGNVAMRHQVWCKKIIGRIRYNNLFRKANGDFLKAQGLFKEINDFVAG